MIQSCELQAGEWIDEVKLTAALGISRTPLREALKVLVGEGLLRIEPRRGCFVNELSYRDLDDILPLRAMLQWPSTSEAPRKVEQEDTRALAPSHERIQAHTTGEHTVN